MFQKNPYCIGVGFQYFLSLGCYLDQLGRIAVIGIGAVVIDEQPSAVQAAVFGSADHFIEVIGIEAVCPAEVVVGQHIDKHSPVDLFRWRGRCGGRGLVGFAAGVQQTERAEGEENIEQKAVHRGDQLVYFNEITIFMSFRGRDRSDFRIFFEMNKSNTAVVAGI